MTEPTVPAKERLALALEDLELLDISVRARNGEFHDQSPHEDPQAALLEALKLYMRTGVKGVRKLMGQVRAGEFEDSER